ncbi:MAG: hypothetical protein M3Q08_02450 [Pseudomonadota bacterium]|nr:hypothetical protein [Pseudomonadota bacterium]
MPKIGFGQLIADANDEVAYCDQNQKGFILLTLTPEFARGDYIAVSTVLEKPYTTRTIAAFETRASARSRRLQRLR